MESVVFGRQAELREVETMLERARHAFAALVLEGDAGIGKTSVWRAGIASAADGGARVLSCRATQAEASLSFAALGDLVAPVEPTAFDTLPAPQRRALDAALLRTESGGAAPNPRAIGTGLVTLLRTLAASAPLVVAIDDVQWLDRPSAHALAFALRRLEPQPIALLATRRLGVPNAAAGLLTETRVRPLRIGPVSLAALYRIVETRLDLRLPRPLLVRIERAAGGNPFFALEIARALGARGRLEAGEALPIPDDLSQLVTERLRKLPRRTQEALLRVSALAQPTLAAVAVAALEPAERAGIVRVAPDGRIEFTHPVFASAVYAAASHARRRKLHAELAAIVGDDEERARHLVLARAGAAADESVAAVLEVAAAHAAMRGALDVAAELCEQAALFTPEERMTIRHQRALRAARHHFKTGDPDRSLALCELVLAAAPPNALRCEALHQLAEIRMAEQPAEAIPLLSEALVCAGDDLARAARLEIALAMVLGSTLDLAAGLLHAARSIDLAERAGVASLLAEAIAIREVTRFLSGAGLDEAALQQAIALEDPDHEVPFQMRASFNAATLYQFVGKIDVARALHRKLHEHLAARGEEADLPYLVCNLALTSLLAGSFEAAEHEADDAERGAALTGIEVVRAFALMVRTMSRACRGDAESARADAAETLALSERLRWPHGPLGARWALGVLALSEGDPRTAANVLEPVVQQVEALGAYEWPIANSLPEAIEALVAIGELERATRLTRALADWGARFDRPWALATAGRCEALLAGAAGDFERASAAAAAALSEHERLPMPFERARTLLVKGQLLRRAGERRAARATLEEANALFESMGAVLWAERARAELARIGVRKAPAELTESEQRVAELAATGLTNPEIAARLFMSRRTVEANLARAYRKLDIRSRAELGAVMAVRKASPSS